MVRPALTVVALLVTGQHEAFGTLDLIKDVLLLGGVHLGRAGTLVTRGRGHVPDDGHTGTRLERQCGGVVLQQHTGAFRDFPCDRMMRSRDVVREQVITANSDECGRSGDFGDFSRTLVKVGLRQRSRTHRVLQLARGSEARRRHLQRPARFDGRDSGIGTTPIGNDHAVETPFIAQNLLQ